MRTPTTMIGTLILLTWVATGAVSAQPATIKYKSGDTAMVGYLARPLGQVGRAPGILVVPDWMGLGPYARRRADELAGLGYVALAVDMYGGGKMANDNTEAAQLAGDLKKGDRAELRRRATAALETLTGLPQVDTNRLAAIGYCFGGTVVLELARGGAPLKGVVSFHGGLDTPSLAKTGMVQAAVLVCHGADDPFVPKKDVEAFQAEMREAGADWQMILYSGAVHSFTKPEAGSDPSSGQAYNANADHRSWTLMQQFFKEIFAPRWPL